MKVYLSKEEWWPVYSVYTDAAEGGREVDLDSVIVEEYKKVCAAFNKLHSIIDIAYRASVIMEREPKRNLEHVIVKEKKDY